MLELTLTFLFRGLDNAMTHIDPPSPTYLGPPKHFSAGDNKPIKRIVIHSAVTPCQPGMARLVARLFREGQVNGSAHYCIDPLEVVQSAFDSVICWHAPPNQGSIGNEMADHPTKVPGRWLGRNHRRVLRKTARLTARQCLAWHLPIQWLTVADLKMGKRGITSHNNISKAFGQSSHWDPGQFPRRRFMRLVRKYAKQIKERELNK